MKGGDRHRVSLAGRISPAGQATLSATETHAILGELEALDASNLQMRWREAFGRNPPARLGVDLLRRVIAYRVQELELGGLSRQARLRLKAAGSQAGKENTSRGSGSSPFHVKAGTRFVREWQGEVHEVEAIDTGNFVYRGKTYRSLSTLAREITGTHQSGPRFFGISRGEPQKARKGVVNG